MAEEKVEKIEKVSNDLASEETQSNAPNEEYFNELMQSYSPEKEKALPLAVNDVKKPSLIDHVRESSNFISTTKPSMQQAIAQANDAVQQIDGVKELLESNSSNLHLTKRDDVLLQSRLNHIDESLKITLSKAGAEFTSVAEVHGDSKGLLSPIQRYLGYLSSAQDQLQNLGDHLGHIASTNGVLNAANLLAIQVKIGNIQQQMEFFTNVLNKVLESTKTLMNIQV